MSTVRMHSPGFWHGRILWGSVTFPSLQGGCEAGLAKWLGYYSDLLIFLPQPGQGLYCGWDIGSFLTPTGGQFTKPVYRVRLPRLPGRYNGLPHANLCVPTSGSHPTHWPCLDTPMDGSRVKKHFLEFSVS